MGERLKIIEYFIDVETGEEHNGYFCSVGEAGQALLLTQKLHFV
jgi:hypothetical protein